MISINGEDVQIDTARGLVLDHIRRPWASRDEEREDMARSDFACKLRFELALHRGPAIKEARCYRGKAKVACSTVSWADDLDDHIETDYVSPWESCSRYPMLKKL